MLFACASVRCEQPITLEQLMPMLRKSEPAHARFVETRTLRILNKPLVLTGTLVYVPPDRLERHTLTPRPQSMVVDADRLVLEDKTRGRTRTLALQDHPVLWAFIESFRATLAGDLATLERFYRVELEGSEAHWGMQLTPREDAMLAVVRTIRIEGSDGRVARVEIEEVHGDRSVMTIVEDSP